MIEKIKDIIAYVFRGWDSEPGYTPNKLKIIPPFLFEALSYLLLIGIIFKALSYLWSLL
jgi:hypothetical protein